MRFPFFRKREPDPEWYSSAPAEAIQRKERSEKYLRFEGIPINRNLPCLCGTEAEANPRSAQAVADRIAALTLVAVKGEGPFNQETMDELCHRYNAWDTFSEKELEFMKEPTPDSMRKTQFCWRYEALWTVIWAARFFTEMPKPEQLCNVPQAVSFLKELGREGLFHKDCSITRI